MKKTKEYYGWFISSVYFIIGLFCITYFDGTGDAGDSIQHYLIAKYAPYHPTLYFDHWGKPLFTLLASPFAQFGFIGIKLFNLIVACMSILFTFKAAKVLTPKIAWITPLLLISSTMFFTLTFSGLTEHLFALLTIIGFYLFIKNKFTWAVIIISFLPFVRTEGIIIMGVFGFILLLHKNWKILPLLLFGHIIYAVAGYFTHGDILWVINKIPYISTENPYGNGILLHYIYQLNYVIGLPLYILFWVGLCFLIFKLFNRKDKVNNTHLLLFSIPFAFILFHSLIWYFGIFNSFGMKRVLVDISPFFAIIGTYAFALFHKLNKNERTFNVVASSVILATFLFHLTPNHAAIHWKRDLNLLPDQKCALEVKNYIHENKLKITQYSFNHPYIAEALNIDPFNESISSKISYETLKNHDKGHVIIWENWFGKESFENIEQIKDAGFKTLFHCTNNEDREIHYYLLAPISKSD